MRAMKTFLVVMLALGACAAERPVEVRVRRIMDREGISEEYARNRINAQQPDSYYADNCHYVLENDSTEEKFQEKTRALFTRLLTE